MKFFFLSTLLLSSIFGAAHAQDSSNWQNYLEIKEPYFKETRRNRQRVIDYMPNFKNVSDRRVIKVRFSTDFMDGEGKIVFKTRGLLTQLIKPGSSSWSKEYYSFFDNQFLNDDTYDILLPLFEIRDKDIQKIEVQSIEFEDGEILKFEAIK